jgi:alpha-mannosidase
MGRHHIRWAIMPHIGQLSPQTVRAAYNFNTPMTLASAKEGRKIEKDLFKAIIVTGSESLVLDCVKRGEDDEDVSRGELTKRPGRSIILRIYESMGGKSRGTIETTLPVKKIYKCNLLEDDGEECKMRSRGKCDFELRAFEVATFRLQL